MWGRCFGDKKTPPKGGAKYLTDRSKINTGSISFATGDNCIKTGGRILPNSKTEYANTTS